MFKPKCPVSPKAQAWIEQSMDWLTGQFGDGLMRADVLLPSVLMEGYKADAADAQRLLTAICQRMGAPLSAIDLEIIGQDPDLHARSRKTSDEGELGQYTRIGDRFEITIPDSLLKDPVALAATIAHEVAHVRLLGENRVTAEQYDQEQLTDLACVFFGLGVFTANAAYDYTQQYVGPKKMTANTSRLGYLGEEMCSYALAYFAYKRGESDPCWAAELDTNPRVFIKQGLRFLTTTRP